MLLSEVIGRVIELARIVQREKRARSAKHPDGRLLAPVKEIREKTAVEKELRDFLLTQPVAVVYATTIVMYVGRGDFAFQSVAEFLDQYDAMKVSLHGPKDAIRQMLEKMPLPDYLEKGLVSLQESGLDVDKLLGD